MSTSIREKPERGSLINFICTALGIDGSLLGRPVVFPAMGWHPLRARRRMSCGQAPTSEGMSEGIDAIATDPWLEMTSIVCPAQNP
jgi:hypothetical protein